jgi:hypothetical protein
LKFLLPYLVVRLFQLRLEVENKHLLLLKFFLRISYANCMFLLHGVQLSLYVRNFQIQNGLVLDVASNLTFQFGIGIAKGLHSILIILKFFLS